MAQMLNEDPKVITELFAYAATFPDFPQNFTPPSLLDPHYVPPNRSHSIIIYAYFMIGFTTLAVIFRLWVRKTVKGMVFGWDDYLILPAQV
jgi:hypothetical protein